MTIQRRYHLGTGTSRARGTLLDEPDRSCECRRRGRGTLPRRTRDPV